MNCVYDHSTRLTALVRCMFERNRVSTEYYVINWISNSHGKILGGNFVQPTAQSRAAFKDKSGCLAGQVLSLQLRSDFITQI